MLLDSSAAPDDPIFMTTKNNLLRNTLYFLMFSITTLSVTSHAGVYTLTQFHNEGDWSLGLEPEITLSSGSGFGLNTKFTYGLSSLSNVQFGIGPGSGARGFRIGGGYTWDFIPDLDGQVGTGIAAQIYFYRLRSGSNQTEFTLSPYVHKGFKLNNGTSVDPYVSLPFGMALLDRNYRGIITLATGAFFRLTPTFAYSAELGLNIANNDSYIAGGVTYFH